VIVTCCWTQQLKSFGKRFFFNLFLKMFLKIYGGQLPGLIPGCGPASWCNVWKDIGSKHYMKRLRSNSDSDKLMKFNIFMFSFRDYWTADSAFIMFQKYGRLRLQKQQLFLFVSLFRRTGRAELRLRFEQGFPPRRARSATAAWSDHNRAALCRHLHCNILGTIVEITPFHWLVGAR